MKKTAIFIMALLIVSATSAKADLVGRWCFDGDALDSSAYGNDGVVYGGAGYVPSPMDQALSLDGYDDHAEVADDDSLEPAAVTVEAWVRNSATPGSYKYIVSKYATAWPGSRSSYALYTGSGGGLYFYIGSTAPLFVLSPYASPALWDGQWHYVAGTYDGSTVRLYVDGTEVGSGTSTSAVIGYDDGDLYIGTYVDQIRWHFPGDIDEVRIWNEALTELPSVLVIEVEIDIKPGSFPNSINPNAGGVIPVAILTTADFDASTVDPATVQLEGADARGKGKSGNYGSMEDVDGDGDLDLVVQIENTITWATDATQATLTGNLKIEYGSTPIEGTDSVNIVPPE